MKTIKIYAGRFLYRKVFSFSLTILFRIQENLKKIFRKDGVRSGSKSVAIKKRKKGKKFEGKISPLVSNVRRILLFRAFISPRLCRVEEAEERKRGNFLTFPGFPAVHMRRSAVVDSAFCFINVVVHYDTYKRINYQLKETR